MCKKVGFAVLAFLFELKMDLHKCEILNSLIIRKSTVVPSRFGIGGEQLKPLEYNDT